MQHSIQVKRHPVILEVPEGMFESMQHHPGCMEGILERFDDTIHAEEMNRHILRDFQMISARLVSTGHWQVEYARSHLRIVCKVYTERPKEEIQWGNLEFEVHLTEAWRCSEGLA